MAGGRGERMRGAGSVPKPLVPIRGVPLLERNLVTLLWAGYRDLVVAVPSHTPEIGEFAMGRGCRQAQVYGASLRVFEENRPLGNIGGAAKIGPVDSELLVVYADNLTTLSLPSVVEHHRRTGAALTVAVHVEPFQIPFGAVEIEHGQLVSYREKPELRIPVSSGVYVLGPAAIAAIPRDEPVGASRLVSLLFAARERVVAYEHEALWIDINDIETVARAESLLAAHPQAFEYCSEGAGVTVVSTLSRRAGRVLLERRAPDANRYPATWDLPGRVLEPGEAAGGHPACVFDDLDPGSSRVYRHLVLVADPSEPLPPGAFWHDVSAPGPLSPVARRALGSVSPP